MSVESLNRLQIARDRIAMEEEAVMRHPQWQSLLLAVDDVLAEFTNKNVAAARMMSSEAILQVKPEPKD